MTRIIARLIALAGLAAGALWGQILTVNCTPASLPQLVGTAVLVQCSASGGTTPYTWSIGAGALPPGLTQNATSGDITGPLQDPAGGYNFTVLATDSTLPFGLTGSQSYKGTTVDPLTLICTSLLGPAEVGVLYTNSTCTAAGGTLPYNWSINPVAGHTEPPGMGSAITPTGNPPTISYLPASPLGAYEYDVVVTDSSAPALSNNQVFSGTMIAPAVAIATSLQLPPATVGSLYSQTFTVVAGSGVSPYGWAAAGLPGWLTMSTGGLLTGTPTSTSPVSFTATVTDAAGGMASGPFSLTVNPALAITTNSPLPAGTVGVNYSEPLTATGGSGIYTWAVAAGSSLPGGLSLNATTGVISGPATTPGTTNFTIQVTDTNKVTATKQFTLTINQALVITTNSPLPQGTVGVNYSQTLTATGGSGTYTWAVKTGSSLPGSLSLNATTGVISGPPTAIGTANFTIQVTDSNQVTVSKPFTLTINPPLVITTNSALPTATVGVNYSQTLTATGGSGTYTWAVSAGSSLPGGLSLNAATGAISGPPTTAGTAIFTIQVTDANNVTATKQFGLIINPALVIKTTSPLPPGTVGVNYSQSMTATGGSGSYTWAVTVGSLPSPLVLNSATGAISGQPTAPSNSSFTIQVTDSNQVTASSPFSLTIDAPIAITTSSPLANGIVGVAYNQQLTGTGGATPYTWSLATGSAPLPGGLTLGAANGVISGTPNATGSFLFLIQLSDGTIPANTITKQFAITIGAGLTITTAPTLPNATVGVAYKQSLAAAGGAPPYKWSPTGALPAPLAALSLDTSGAITGTPTATGTGTFEVTVTDSVPNTQSQTFTLTIVTPPVITTTSLPNGTLGAPYSQTLAASGGTSPYTWTVASGSLPVGLSLSTGGVITGKPSAAGPSNFKVQLTDATGVTASQALTLTISAGVSISTPSPLPTGEATIAYSQTLAAAGGTKPYTWSVTGGTLPPGLTLAASGLLAGTPSTAGTFNFTVQATDSNNITASAPLGVTIVGALAISTPAALNGGSLNASYSQTLAASAGVGPYTWTLTTGPLPPGLSLSAAGVIAGTPTATGAFPFTAKVTDSLGATASRQFTIVIVAGLTITTPPTLPGATVGVPYADALQALGGTAPYTWIHPSGSVPAGLSVTSNGTVTGIPTAAGSSTFTVQVSDSAGHQASEQLTMTVAPALSVSTSSLPGGTVGGAYSQSLAATGGTPPYTWSLLKGSLPGGLSLVAAGKIAGTASAAGTFSFTVEVTDSAAVIATKQLAISVAGGLAIQTAAALPNASLNASYSQTLAAAGGTPPYTWALTAGALPTPLKLSAAGAITGTPTAAGTFQFTITVTDSAKATASQQFTLVVGGGLAIATTTLPGGTLGKSYSRTLTATGGTSPYTFTTSAGSLPPGITLTGAVLSGTPNKSGSYTFTIQVTDSVSATATQQFTVVITNLAITTSSPLPAATVGAAYSQTLAVGGGTPPYTWALTGGALPAGLTLSPAGALSGTPTAAGTFQFAATVTDGAASTASQQFTLVSEISASFSGLSSTAAPMQQLSGSLALGAAYVQEITGQVTLAFQPDASLASPADDPSIQFSTGGRTASFTMPANSTTPVSFALQTGTVAGTITLTVSWQAGGATLPIPAALTQTIKIAPAAPVISAVTASTTSSGFQVVITGYSNTREVSQALLQFTPAAGQTLQTTSLTVSLATAGPTWFQSSTSDQYGSQFILTLPFTVTNGSASTIGSVSVQLVNSQGTSTSSSATL